MADPSVVCCFDIIVSGLDMAVVVALSSLLIHLLCAVLISSSVGWIWLLAFALRVMFVCVCVLVYACVGIGFVD